MTKKDSTQTTSKFQSRELNASVGELYRSSWYIHDMSKLLIDAIEEEGEPIGSLSPMGAVGLVQVIQATASKVSQLAQRIQDNSDAKDIDWEDIHCKVFEVDEGVPVSKANWDDKIGAKRTARIVEQLEASS